MTVLILKLLFLGSSRPSSRWHTTLPRLISENQRLLGFHDDNAETPCPYYTHSLEHAPNQNPSGPICHPSPSHALASIPLRRQKLWPKVAWTVTWINTNDMEVGIGLRCPRGMYLILYSYWSGSDTGRRFLACSQVKESCGFNYWIDQDCVRRDQRVIKDLLFIKWSLAVLYPHSAAQCEWYVC